MDVEKKQSKTSDLYGSFFIDNTEFAIHVNELKEVVEFPEKMFQMPLSPEYLIGIFNLRGIIVPIVCLRKLLGYEPQAQNTFLKIAIIDHEGIKMGLSFTATGEVLKVKAEEKHDFRYQPSTNKQVVRGAIKLNEGKRILQLIDATEVVKIENIPYVLEHQRQFLSAKQQGLKKKCISFSSAGISMAIEISHIHEILKVPEIQKSSFESEISIGMIHLRGQMIPIIAFSKILRLPSNENASKEDQRIIVLKLGQESFGLLVDSVNSIRAFSEEEIMPIPLLSKDRAEMFLGCIEYPESHEVLLLNHSQILSNKDIIEVTQGHNQIYRSKDHQKTAKRQVGREVFILFKLDQLFGIPINDVKEILELPKELMNAPDMRPHVRGLLNLRGELITIIDTRCLYGLEKRENHGSKILIFKCEKDKFGLIVDSVESILTVNNEQKMTIPPLLYEQSKAIYQKDIKEAIEVTFPDGKKQTLIVLELVPIFSRIKQEPTHLLKHA